MSDTAFRLLETHQKLDQLLRDEERRRWPDLFRIAKLKKRKLLIKDRIARLARPARYQMA